MDLFRKRVHVGDSVSLISGGWSELAKGVRQKKKSGDKVKSIPLTSS